ncbi:conserved hypothetical protein [Histoplasma capsulatum var. duboisii H88]|uniref:Uncharacterized protein n=1 Tax=Ajellomyces capsulatus (strain H88) TaxID=544711 RepID=F0UMT2_AJEC8|nr:conserved hypothetical protein [Histoplasma capsulatum var. duboisii H88]
MLLVHPFNVDGAIASKKMERMNYKDGDGEPLISCSQHFSDLEIAHMIRHTFMSAKTVGVQPRLPESKKTALLGSRHARSSCSSSYRGNQHRLSGKCYTPKYDATHILTYIRRQPNL